MFKLGNFLIVSGILLILLSAIGSFLSFLPEIINGYYLSSAGTTFTVAGITINKRYPLNRR
ncbi:hypothetical protein MHH70_00585 [Metasolibacillus sp. FSL H7-0170]|uniref:hypothetical protein n=1 Tax=Metasolibacillus sp. FSL H7-0170 TaxID=2921431 RepID=UPI003157FF69